MDAVSFLKAVTPSDGIKIIAELVPNDTGRTWWKYHKYENHHLMAKAAGELDAQGKTVYFAVNSYGDWYTDEETGRKRIRTQNNVTACRALYDDFDVGDDPKKYASRADAAAGVKELARALGRAPVVTSSGGGFHVYFPLMEDTDKATWERLSAKKRAIARHLGLKVDPAVDMDSARVLRPLGTHNRKQETARVVKVVSAGVASRLEDVEAVMDKYIDTHHLAVSSRTVEPKGDMPDWAQAPEYPPSSAIKIIEHCGALKSVADSRGDCDEPLWRAMLGVVKHSIEGDTLAHLWSEGYAKYDPAETQAKLDAWVTPPTTCVHFDTLTNCSKNCSRWGKQKSPIQLGYSDAPIEVIDTPAPVVQAEAPHITVDKRKLFYFPHGYSWDGRFLSRLTPDEDGVMQRNPFAYNLFYPITRVRTEEGVWALRCASREVNGRWKEFNIPMQDLAAGDTLAKTLAQYEVIIAPGKNTRLYAMTYLTDYLLSLQAADKAVRTYNRFGWADNFETFVIGNTRIKIDGEEEVLCGSSVPTEYQRDFGVQGTAEDWAININRWFNRPGAEINQYALCHAFGAVLVELSGITTWHGVPMALIGPGGQGKSTIAELAAGAFGYSDLFAPQGTKAGSTSNAIVGMVELFNGLPLLVDEISGRTSEELQDLMYAMANGKRKAGMTVSGKLRAGAAPWFSSPFLTANKSVYESLGVLPDSDIALATQLRVFEFAVPDKYLETVFPDVLKSDIDAHKREQYGAAGRKYIRFVMQNKEWVTTQLHRARAKMNPSTGDETTERYYRDDVATAMVAGNIAKQLGLFDFDMKHLKSWVLNHIVNIRANRKATVINPSDYVAHFISELQGRMIVTQELRDSRSEGREEPLVQLRGTAVGRIAIKERRVYIHAKAVSDWCKTNKVPPKVMKDEMDRLGLIIHSPDGVGHKLHIGKGSTIMSSAATCYELNFNKVMGSGKLDLVRPPLPSSDNEEETAQ